MMDMHPRSKNKVLKRTKIPIAFLRYSKRRPKRPTNWFSVSTNSRHNLCFHEFIIGLRELNNVVLGDDDDGIVSTIY